jgi:hypothetical protein
MTKVLLAVEPDDLDTILRLIYNHNHITVETIFNNGKEDAQKMVEEYKECIYDLVFAYVNKDEDFPHGFEIETLKDAIKLSEKAKEFLDNEYFIQNYLGGKIK